MVKASAEGVGDPGFKSLLSHNNGFFLDGIHVTTCQMPGIILSVLVQAGPVLVYSDLVRWQV